MKDTPGEHVAEAQREAGLSLIRSPKAYKSSINFLGSQTSNGESWAKHVSRTPTAGNAVWCLCAHRDPPFLVDAEASIRVVFLLIELSSVPYPYCAGAARAQSHSSGRGLKLSSCRAFSFEAPRRRVA
jgi:hypothetical protein